MKTSRKRNRRSILQRLIPLIGVLLLVAWSSHAWAKLRVVATLPDFAALARDIGGDQVHIEVLASSREDPHYVDPRPSLLVPMSRADLLILNGMELEIGWLPPLIVNSRNSKIQVGASGYFDASTAVPVKLEIPQQLSRAHGDVHRQGNPHYSIDPRAMKMVAQALATRMIQLDSARTKHYQARLAKLVTALDQLAEQQRQRFAALPLPRRTVVTYHRSLTYFLDWLQVRRPITVEPRPGVPPTPRHVAKVLKIIRKLAIPVILQESHFPRNTTQKIARLARAQLVTIPASTDFVAGQTYVAHIQQVCDMLYQQLKP